ncbi:amidohydrolase family protein [Fusobacterium simiae]|uniref:amidohydrolase family protein n=1 Tax=Fusobacterium TaxID=848 RepID=UPI00041B19B2|nr:MULTISPECIES: amidohydrolase family protein [Fusobacterium]MDC7954643.1 amidohydrolase family protein [Fusobacterium simiae]
MSILIKNGLMLSKGNSLSYQGDILIENEKIKSIDQDLNVEAEQVIDANGCIVLPGLIDHHTHLYPFIKKGIPAESVCFSSGVTTAVDAGSSGCETYENVRNFLDYSRLRIKSYLNISSLGLTSLPNLENLDPKFYNKDKIKELFKKYKDELIGLKIRMSKNIVNELGFKPLEETIKIAEDLSVPVMVHSTDPPGPIENIANLLRKNDVLTHMYQKSPFTILNNDKIDISIKKAREKGVVFEAADARLHFSFEICEKALKENFLPDIIATDLTAFSMYQRPTAFSLLMQISKYENLGIPFEKIIKACTTTPAKLLGISDSVGAIKVGYLADIAIIKKEFIDVEFGDKPYKYEDKNFKSGKFVYNCMMTIKNGEIVYRNILF